MGFLHNIGKISILKRNEVFQQYTIISASQNVPPLRLVIPKTYPNGEILVDRAALDLGLLF